MSNETDPCLRCSVRVMRQQGCCTQDVGEGTKLITNGLKRIAVCLHLVVNDGAPYCGNYADRPYECRAFRCPIKIRWDAQRR
jgi:hypothetical protein